MSEHSSPSHTSTLLHSDKISNPDFTGKWRLKEYHGIDEYLKSEGWNWMMRKAISKLGITQYIYHHHMASVGGKEEEHITIKSASKGGGNEMISCVNLNAKTEVKYKDKNGNNVISVFKWNRDKTQIIEFVLTDDDKQTRSNDDIKDNNTQRSYTKCRHMNSKGQMIESITNEHGKTCVSIYVKEEEDQISIRELKQILHLPHDKEEVDDTGDSLAFPVNILDLIEICATQEEDALNSENIAIQREIQEITLKIDKLKEELMLKTEELKANILKNDENICHKNTIKKWTEFERNWPQWDTLYFIGWLRRMKWRNKQFEEYHITKYRVNQFCLKHFGQRFIGKYLLKFECDTLRQLGICDEHDSFCVYQQIIKLTAKYPMKVRESVLKYEPKHEDAHVTAEYTLKTLLSETDAELLEYYPLFKKVGYDDINTICACIQHKGIEYLEQNILSNKLKMNNIALRIKLLDALKKQIPSHDITTNDTDINT
eukprot:257262_1